MANILVSLLILLPVSAVAQKNGIITVGDSLAATPNSSVWLSTSGDFAFGFRSLKENDLFLLSIWFAKIPDQTIVWYANGDNPAPRGSKVELTADGGLVLTGPKNEELWRSNATAGKVAYGVMNNTGNFVLQDSNHSKLWESFQNPTDTLLPTQIIERGGVLSSRQSQTNFSKGKFQLRLLQAGNFVLNTINLPSNHANEPYYDSVANGTQLSLDESGNLVLVESGQQFPWTQGLLWSPNDSYLRATVDIDGLFTIYSYPRISSNNGSWTPLWFKPDNICTASDVSAGSGVCGYNSICILNNYGRPTCECPTGFSSLDPNNQYGSCKPDFKQSCAENETSPEDLYTYKELTNTNFPTSDYVLLKPYSEDQCKASCMADCMCAVAIVNPNAECWKKKLPLSNGQADGSLTGTKALIKIRKNITLSAKSSLSPEPRKNQKKLIMIVLVLLCGSVFVNVISIGSLCLGISFFYHKKLQKCFTDGRVVDTNLRCFTYKELLEATDGFKEELGRGSFGVVYKGVIGKGSPVLLAIKKINSSCQETQREFETEVNVIGQIHHKNLVRLLGFCNEGTRRLLVYEFLSNGSLADFLFGDSKPSWDQRIQIAVAIARGLLYLHEECSTSIIHCDIKPQNILLDNYYNARISDFGLAKLLRMDQSRTLTGIRGTKGYVAPEWFRNMTITAKVDVYSYGVMLLEIVCCRRSVDVEAMEDEKAILTDWAYDCYRQGKLDALIEYDVQALDDRKNLERFLMVAFWCIQEDPSLRPSMRRAAQMLEGVVEVVIPPCPFPFTKDE